MKGSVAGFFAYEKVIKVRCSDEAGSELEACVNEILDRAEGYLLEGNQRALLDGFWSMLACAIKGHHGPFREEQLESVDKSSQAETHVAASIQVNEDSAQDAVNEGAQAARELLQRLYGLPGGERNAIIAHAIGDLISAPLDSTQSQATLARIQGFSAAISAHVLVPGDPLKVAEKRAEHWRDKIHQRWSKAQSHAASLLLSAMLFMRPELAKSTDTKTEVPHGR